VIPCLRLHGGTLLDTQALPGAEDERIDGILPALFLVASGRRTSGRTPQTVCAFTRTPRDTE
jgi:hypothetical protein